MASGHVHRTQSPNTWQHRPSLQRVDSSCQLGAVHTWHIAAELYVRCHGSYRGISGRDATRPKSTRLTHMRHGGLRLLLRGVSFKFHFACRKFL